MPDFVNPYIPDQPVDNPKLFFGRRKVFTLIRENLVRGRRVFVVTGARRMGKSSLLRQLPAYLSEGFVPVRLELTEDDAQGLDWLQRRLVAAMSEQLELVLSDAVGSAEKAFDDFWATARRSLGDQCVVLLLDGIEALEAGNPGLLDSLLSFLSTWREREECLALVVTTTVALHETLVREHPRLFGGALTHELGPLSSEEASRLITWPVDGVLTFDYGVPRRLIEITSGQPYYLQLLCFEVFNRCAPAGWVNLRDLDLVVEDLVGREIYEFQQVWEESTPREQAALAALVSLKGARGVATVREVHTALSRAGARASREQVAEALQMLVTRGILERLGALSYRFRVELLRDWLGDRIDLQAVVRGTRWDGPERGRAAPERRVPLLMSHAERQKEPATHKPEQPEEPEGVEGAAVVRRWWLWAAGAAVVVLVLGMAFGVAFYQAPPAEPTPTATISSTAKGQLATATLTAVLETATEPVATDVPTPTPIPTATPTPSPTPPVVVARSVPSIAYHARDAGGEHYSIYVMNSDGSNRVQVTDGKADAFSPSWSPDGSQITYLSDRDGSSDIWVVELDGSKPVNLTRHAAKDRTPAWSPDGEWIAFASVRDTPYWELYLARPDGSEIQRLTWWEDASDLNPTWSPDGQRLAFASKRDGNWEIYSMDRDGSNLLRLTNHPDDDVSPAWSPDGSRIAFESTREGYTEIFVMPVAGGGATNVTNAPFSSEHGPSWSPDGGRLLFYSDMDGEWDVYVMASDGSDVVKLTGDTSSDQEPVWRP